ncbi:hypothetical protein TcG_11839 [Trypanosoma cruzi]|nr:hypothetical protein TcG_11839 [Trypanosoma cruzi]
MQGNAVPDPLHRSHLPRGRCGKAKASSEGDVVSQIALRRLGLDPPSPSRESALGNMDAGTPPAIKRSWWGGVGCAIWRPSPRGGRLALTRRLRVPQENRRPPQCEIRVPTSDYAPLPPESKAEHSDPQRPRRRWRSRCSTSDLQQ